MLIRFAVENHLSIRERQELSLLASSLQDPAASLIPVDGMKLVPAALIYGANASGKSNFVSALNFLRQSVRYSHARGGPETGVPRNPFILDDKTKALPTKIDIDFFLNNVRFHYGFSASDTEFEEEWLYAFPLGKKQTWFYRGPGDEGINFGKALKGTLKTIATLMRPNSLFLSTAAQNAHKQLTPIFNYLSDFSMKTTIENREHDAMAAFAGGRIDSRIVHFLKQADTGIVSCRFDDALRRIGIDQQSFMKDLWGILKKYIPDAPERTLDGVEKIDVKKISLGHKGTGKEPRYLELRLESAGTLRLLILLKTIFEALDNGSLVVIDELDASLHTYLAESIVALFNSKKTNPRGAQLIATTHDTNLLRSESVRRDQVWFCEKDTTGGTNLYPLTDIHTRNTDNLEKGYLQGRFGAVPFRGPVELLIGPE